MKYSFITSVIISYCLVFFVFPNHIIARQISNYPNGVIVKAINTPKVYYIENGTKRPIESPNMLVSQFRWQDLIIASSVEIDAIPIGKPMTYREGSLLANSGTVYVVSDTRVRPIDSPQSFLSKGYKWNNIVPVSNAELSLHQKGDTLRESDLYPNGSLLLAPGGAVYKLESGVRRYIPSPLIFDSRYRWEYLIPVSQAIIDSYPRGSDEYYPDGLLISSTTGVFMMQNNARMPITSPAVFESYGFKWGQIRRATDYELSIIPEGSPLSEIKSYRSRVLVSPNGNKDIYVVDETGEFKYISSPFIFNKLGYKWDEIITIPSNTLKQYKFGSNMVFQNGSVVSYNGTVYLIANGYKKPIASPEIFLNLGYKWSDVIALWPNEFSQYPTGTTILDIPNDIYNVIAVNDGDDIVVNINGVIEGVKLIGLDAPEKEDFLKAESCFGIESSQALRAFINNNRVKLVKDTLKEDRDDNNRLLRYVYLEDGRSLQEYLLKEGYAKEYTHKGIFYQSQATYKALEQVAKSSKKGFWGAECNQN